MRLFLGWLSEPQGGGLYFVGITDAGLEHLAGHKNLRTLYLGWTEVTDASMKHLAQLKALLQLETVGPDVTDAGIAALKKALPKLKIMSVLASGCRGTPPTS